MGLEDGAPQEGSSARASKSEPGGPWFCIRGARGGQDVQVKAFLHLPIISLKLKTVEHRRNMNEMYQRWTARMGADFAWTPLLGAERLARFSFARSL